MGGAQVPSALQMFVLQGNPSSQQSLEEQKNGNEHVPSSLQMFAVQGSGSTQQPAARLQLKLCVQLPSVLQVLLVQALPSSQLALSCRQAPFTHSRQVLAPPGQFASLSTHMWFVQL
jgi:hypothetical protein